MIKFGTVQGDVLVNDRKNHYTQMAKNGLQLDPSGVYLIATNQNSSAELMFGGKRISLKPSSSMRIMGKKSASAKHLERWGRHGTNSTTMKTIVGRLWLRLAGDIGEDDAGNSAPGVRG